MIHMSSVKIHPSHTPPPTSGAKRRDRGAGSAQALTPQGLDQDILAQWILHKLTICHQPASPAKMIPLLAES